MRKKLSEARVFALKGYTVKTDRGKFYVSPTGSTTWSGPYKSLQHATTAIARKLARASSPIATKGCSSGRSTAVAEQLVFSRILAEAEDQHRAALDRHRLRVQSWFDALPTADKDRLGGWLTLLEWDTCVALSAAAGDWHRCRCVSNGK